MARAKPKPRPKKKPAKPRAASDVPGPLPRWPGATLGAGLAAALMTWGFGGFPIEAEAAAALPWTQALAAALCFGPTAAWAVGAGPLGGLVGAALGLASAGLVTPLGLSVDNWRLALLGIALGGAAHGPSARPAVRPLAVGLVIVGVALLIEGPGPAWALSALGGVLGAWRAPGWSARRVGAAQGLVALGGLALTLDAGFVRVEVPVDRALIAEWGEHSRVLPARSRSVFWTAGAAPVFRAALEGHSFAAPPPKGPGLALPARRPDATDLAELGMASDCEDLAKEALGGEARARVQVVLRGCSPDLAELAASDPVVDAARVLRGAAATRPAALVAAPVDLPLDEPGAVLLAAKLRLGAPKAAAQALVDGGPYDRALLLAHLRDADRVELSEILRAWSAEVPGPQGQDYRDALEAVALR
ncbi:MAG: hypothetical protein H6741_30055 [Alphaproteobacteria bacterium]|nr:hypothetical protein [Alphaproteobacteria bacterium]